MASSTADCPRSGQDWEVAVQHVRGRMGFLVAGVEDLAADGALRDGHLRLWKALPVNLQQVLKRAIGIITL